MIILSNNTYFIYRNYNNMVIMDYYLFKYYLIEHAFLNKQTLLGMYITKNTFIKLTFFNMTVLL